MPHDPFRTDGALALHATGHDHARTDGDDLLDECLARLALDAASPALMVVDGALIIRYANHAAAALFARHAGAFNAVFPFFNPEALVGASIGGFSPDPGQLRAVAADPLRLPHRLDLRVGTRWLAMTVTTRLDGDRGRAVLVEWRDVTDEPMPAPPAAAAPPAAHGDVGRSMAHLESVATTLAAAAEEMTAVSAQLGATADETSAQAGVASAASEQVSRSVHSVATGAEEMSASILEIARNATEAAKVAAKAVRMAERTNATVTQLGESSRAIGQVLKLITAIAQQTNMLALNATIEAARAGEAGKGFAVVATEVKALARETARATEDVAQRIEAIQRDAHDAVGAIRDIAAIIGQIADTQATIASAVEEQTATTNDISRSVTEVAKGSREIASSITSVAAAARGTSGAAADTRQAAAELARMAAGLQDLIRTLAEAP